MNKCHYLITYGMIQNITVLFYSPQKHKNTLLMTVRCQKVACCSFGVWCLIVVTVKSHFHLQGDQHLTEWDWKWNVISECVYHIKAWVYKFQSRERQPLKVEQCQLQIDDLICLMDGASAFSYLPFCQCLSGTMQHCRATPLLCSKIALSFHSNHMN